MEFNLYLLTYINFNSMKKILFLLLLVLGSFGSASAQTDGVAILSRDTYDAANSTDQLYKFTDSSFELVMNGRKLPDPAFSHPVWTEKGIENKCLNFKNNAPYNITIPAGVKVYRIDIMGYSQSTDNNWNYLLAWGVGDADLNGTKYEFVDPIGAGVQMNIKSTAKYPMDPCSGLVSVKDGTLSESTDPNNTIVASLDFGDMPYEGEFPFYGSGNNQYGLLFKIYTTREAADNAGTGTGISSIVADKAGNGIRYNIAGQRVDSNYKGIVIENGRKKIVK